MKATPVPVVALNLKFTEADIEPFDEFFEHVSALTHEFLSLLLSHDADLVDLCHFEVGEQEHKDLLNVSGNLHKVDLRVDLVEIPVQDLPKLVDPLLVIPNVHWRRPPPGN